MNIGELWLAMNIGEQGEKEDSKYKRMLLVWEAVGQEGFISLVFSYRVLYAHFESWTMKKAER